MYTSAIAILAALCVVSTTNAAAPVRQRTKTVHQSSITTDEQYDPYMGISQHRHAMEEDHSMSMKGDDHSMSMKGDDHDGHGHGEDDHSDDKEMVDESSSATVVSFGTIGASLALTGAVALL